MNGKSVNGNYLCVGGIAGVVGLVILVLNLLGLYQISSMSDSMNKIHDVSSLSLSSGDIHGNIFAQALISADNPQAFDSVTGVGGKYISVRRQVKYYQWIEHKQVYGGGRSPRSYSYTYIPEWTDSPVDSSSFHDKFYSNTCKVNLHNEKFYTDNVKFGPWNASPEFLDTISKENYTAFLDPNANLKRIYKDMTISGNSIYVGNSDYPEVGDVRISYSYIVEGIYSGLGDVSSGYIYPVSKDPEFFFTVRPGRENKASIISDVIEPKIKQKKNFVILGFVFLAIGFVVILFGLFAPQPRFSGYGNSSYGDNVNTDCNDPFLKR